MLYSSLIFIFQFFFIPFLLGLLFVPTKYDNHYCGAAYIMNNHINGFVFMLAIFELLCVPLIFLKIRLHILLFIYSAIILIISLTSLFLIFKKKRKIYIRYSQKPITKENKIYVVFTVIFICIQLYSVVHFQSNWMSGDDSEYVTRTSASLYTDRILSTGGNFISTQINPKRSFCSWEIFIAWLCKLSGISVPTMVHTVLNLSLCLMALCVFYLIGYELFENYMDRFIFILVVSFANMFGLYSHYSLTFRWLATLWQGKAVFMVLIFQYFIVFMLKVSKEKVSKEQILQIVMLSLATCSLTPTGVGMFLGSLMILTIFVCCVKKNPGYLIYLISGMVFPMVFLISYLYYR